ncbi:MAG: hypothetical protein Q9200_003101 [Gallowayella weberi]
MEELRAVRSSLSDTSKCDGHVQTDTTVQIPTEAAVARVIRAELRRVLKPTVEQCLNTFKADSDDQYRSILKKIDELAEHFGQDHCETDHSYSSTAPHSKIDLAFDQEIIHHDTGATELLEPATMGYERSIVPERPDSFPVRRSKHWRRSHLIKWAIGTLRVTVSSTHTISNVSYAGDTLQPQTDYQIKIEFQPAQFLIALRGLTLCLAHTQDQSGYYQVCPLLATFAIVPTNADVMKFAWRNDVAGLQYLFERRLAAPSDRFENDDIVGDLSYVLLMLTTIFPGKDIDPEQIKTYLNHIQFLKQGGFAFYRTFDVEESSLWIFCNGVLSQHLHVPIKHRDLGLRVALELDGDISAFGYGGRRPLSYIFFLARRFRKTNPKVVWRLIELTTMLLHHGADPCDLNLDGSSPFEAALHCGFPVEFVIALGRCGHDVKEVLDEVRRRQWIFHNGQGESTIVDNESIASPSSIGLSRRRVITRETDED